MKVPFSPPHITESDIAAVVATLRSGWITSGPRVREFEHALAQFSGAVGAVATNSATSALELTLRVLGIGPGDEVIVPAYTYTATASVVHHVGATIVMADCEAGGFQVDASRLSNLITPRTKALIAVDIGGVPCDYARLRELAISEAPVFRPTNRQQEQIGRVAVIADAAHSLGAEFQGTRSGGLADFSCFSFHAVKNLTTAEGGAITWSESVNWDSAELYRLLKLWSLHGQTADALAKTAPGAWEYDVEFPGYKCNMTDIAASLGLSQLSRYEATLDSRRRAINHYRERLEGLPVQSLATSTPFWTSSAHLMMIQIEDGREARDGLIAALAEQGISANVHFKPLPMLSAYKTLGFRIEDFPEAQRSFEREISLPLFESITNEQIEYVVGALHSAYARKAPR